MTKVVLYLEDWQRNMMKDYLNNQTDRLELPLNGGGGGGGVIIAYAVPTPHSKAETKRMYLTEWQMKEIKDAVGVTCDFIELDTNVPYLQYGVSTK